MSAAEKVPGVRVVRDGDLVAVLHAHRDEAGQGARAREGAFTPTTALDDATIFDHLVKNAPAGETPAAGGDLATGEAAAAGVRRNLLHSYVAHAPMETHSAVAAVANGKVTVWAGTQTPFPLKTQIDAGAEVPADKVRVITPYVGGGFGGKSGGPQAVEAARLARLAGEPVRVVSSREEEFFYDTFRPAAFVKIRSGLDAAKPDHVLGLPGLRRRRPRRRAILRHPASPDARPRRLGRRRHARLHPFAVGPWRAPGGNTQHLRPRVPHRHHGGQGGHGPGGIPAEEPRRPAHGARAQGRRAKFGWTPKAGAERTRRRRGAAARPGTYVAPMAEVRSTRPRAPFASSASCAPRTWEWWSTPRARCSRWKAAS